MIHVISAANRHLYEDVIEAHYRIRHDIFSGERGWKALTRPDGREVDAYDNEDTVYLLAMEDERIVGGNRLYPTLRPTMMEEVFPHLASVRGIPSGPTTWEWSRLFAIKERRDSKLYFELMASLHEFCLDEGITELSGVMETWWLPRLQQLEFTVHPLGLPDLVENQMTMAARFVISADTLHHIKAMANIKGSVLVRRGPQHSLVGRALEMQRQATAKAS
jgi:acyl-homoserine lactone synthase